MEGNIFSGKKAVIENLDKTMKEWAEKFPPVKFGPSVKEIIKELEKYGEDDFVLLMGGHLWVCQGGMMGLSPIKPILAQDPILENVKPNWMKTKGETNDENS